MGPLLDMIPPAGSAREPHGVVISWPALPYYEVTNAPRRLSSMECFGLQKRSGFWRSPSLAHATALPREPFIALVGPLPFARGLLTMETLRAEGVALFSGRVPLRRAAMGRALDGEALGWMCLEDQRITPSSRPTLAKASSPRSRSSRRWAAEIITRMRALPRGTVG